MPNPPVQKSSQTKATPKITPGTSPANLQTGANASSKIQRSASPAAINPEFLERYQIELQKNPRSRVFAPLAEAYRKMGMIPEALRICRVGVGANPDFSGGLVAYAKVLIETGKFEDALTLLRKATTISPDNLLAHSLMGDALLELRKPKDALKAFKMVLFLNPEDEKAKSTVRKWEFLTADEFDDEEFAMRPLFDNSFEGMEADLSGETDHQHLDNLDHEESYEMLTTPGTSTSGVRRSLEERISEAKSMHRSIRGLADGGNSPRRESRSKTQNDPDQRGARQRAKELERALSLADAFTVRNDLASALETLERAQRTLGTSPDISNRLAMLARRTQVLTSDISSDTSIESSPTESYEQEDSEESRMDLQGHEFSGELELPEPELPNPDEQFEDEQFEENEADENGPESFTMNRLQDPLPRFQSNASLQRASEKREPVRSSIIAQSHAPQATDRARGGLQARINEAKGIPQSRGNAQHFLWKRRVVKLEALLHRISERRLD